MPKMWFVLDLRYKKIFGPDKLFFVPDFLSLTFNPSARKIWNSFHNFTFFHIWPCIIQGRNLHYLHFIFYNKIIAFLVLLFYRKFENYMDIFPFYLKSLTSGNGGMVAFLILRSSSPPLLAFRRSPEALISALFLSMGYCISRHFSLLRQVP